MDDVLSPGGVRQRQRGRGAGQEGGLALRGQAGARGVHAPGEGEGAGDRLRGPHQPRL